MIIFTFINKSNIWKTSARLSIHCQLTTDNWWKMLENIFQDDCTADYLYFIKIGALVGTIQHWLFVFRLQFSWILFHNAENIFVQLHANWCWFTKLMWCCCCKLKMLNFTFLHMCPAGEELTIANQIPAKYFAKNIYIKNSHGGYGQDWAKLQSFYSGFQTMLFEPLLAFWVCLNHSLCFQPFQLQYIYLHLSVCLYI